MSDKVFFDPVDKSCIDGIRPDGFGQYSGKTLEELSFERGVDLVVMGGNEAYLIYCDKFKTEPVEITEEQFRYFLEVLPPCKWVRNGDTESFFMSERTAGNITAHLVRIGKRYYKFEDEDTLSHEDKVRKCMPLKDAEK